MNAIIICDVYSSSTCEDEEESSSVLDRIKRVVRLRRWGFHLKILLRR